jgi:UDP-glucuronate decarboxylase
MYTYVYYKLMTGSSSYTVITGGAGFIGRHLCSRLLTETDTHIICVDNLCSGSTYNIEEFMDNPKFQFLQMDVTAPDIIECINNIVNNSDRPLTTIYHLACMASPDKYKKQAIETLNTCFLGTQYMLLLAKEHNARFLITSTSEVYGDPAVHPQPEEYYGNVNTVGERSCYDEGKRVAETLVYEYRNKMGVDAKIVRIFNTYGPYMDIDDGRVITNFIKQILRGEPLQIYGDGKQTRSFCYIDDMVNGLVAMMGSCEQGPINLGNPNCEFTLLELIYLMEKLLNMPLQTDFHEATENDPKQRKPVIEKANRLLGFEPKIPLSDGLMRTIKYFIKQLHRDDGK